MTPEQWDEFAAVFPEIRELPRLTDDELAALHEDYVRGEMAEQQEQKQ
jgi:hypothetical protein